MRPYACGSDNRACPAKDDRLSHADKARRRQQPKLSHAVGSAQPSCDVTVDARTFCYLLTIYVNHVSCLNLRDNINLMLVHELVFFFFNDTATTEIYTLSLHDALPFFFKEPAADLHSPFYLPRRLPV